MEICLKPPSRPVARSPLARRAFDLRFGLALVATCLLAAAMRPLLCADSGPLVQPRELDGSGAVEITGALKRWHKVTLTLDGPFAHERDVDPNPFTDYRMTVVFTHESGSPSRVVPGYFVADGRAAETSAERGTKWRAHLSPDAPGSWTYAVTLVRGKHAALDDEAARRASPLSGASGSFSIAPGDEGGRDFRAKGRLEYVGRHHLRFAGTGEYFLKAGADSPENLLAYADFDGTYSGKARGGSRPGEAAPKGLKTWGPHVRDWHPGDPTWKGGKGKGLIGALNYLSSKGCNAFSFLTYNAGGDGDDVWPFVDRDEKLHYDCSKLDQWGIVFDHATAVGLYLHFKMQETEMDDDRGGKVPGPVPTSLDGGKLGVERKLYCREIVARFGHALALNWNLGEENTQSPQEQRDMARYLRAVDPYRHHIVVHTYPNQQDKVYPELLGEKSVLTGASLQNGWNAAHGRTLKWVTESARAGRPWVVANDEQNPADLGVPPDPGYAGFGGRALQDGGGSGGGSGSGERKGYDLHDIRKLTLWGTLMAGGAGVEYYFGYKLPQNDLLCEDWRSRDRSWDYCRIAIEFFRDNEIPFWEMASADGLIGGAKSDDRRHCLAKAGAVYLVYLPGGGTTDLDLGGARGPFTVRWFDPRSGGPLRRGSVEDVVGGGRVSLGRPPEEPGEDWLVVVRKG